MYKPEVWLHWFSNLCHLTHPFDVSENINLNPCNKLLKAPDTDVTSSELSEQARWQSFRKMKPIEALRATKATLAGIPVTCPLITQVPSNPVWSR